MIAHVLTVKPGKLEAFAQQAIALFDRYPKGIRPAGVLVTLDQPNNFPRHPVRSDGPHLVWLGILEDAGVLETGWVGETSRQLWATSLLRSEPETVVLQPTRRSRLRWIQEQP